jgi:sRNA-binding carbon storage regulator CsrA
MIVISRKKHECLVIDGVIRVEVVNLIQGVVCLRLMAPRAIKVDTGAAGREPIAPRDEAKGSKGTGLDLLHLTMATRDVIRLGETMSLGIVDADKSRALLFVDAPQGARVIAEDKPESAQDQKTGSQQCLLQFMDQSDHVKRTEQPEAVSAGPEPASRDERTADGPTLLPFAPPPCASARTDGAHQMLLHAGTTDPLSASARAEGEGDVSASQGYDQQGGGSHGSGMRRKPRS